LALRQEEIDSFAHYEWWALNRKVLAPKTVRDYLIWIRHADRHLPHGLAAATTKQLTGYADTLKPTASLRNNVRSSLLSYFAYLVHTGQRKSNPALALPRRREPRYLPKPINHPQALIEEARRYSPIFACLVTLYLYTGLRLSEVINLRWEDMGGEWVNVVQKGGQVRCVFFNETCIEALRVWRSACPCDVLVFPSPVKEGCSISGNWVWSKIRDLGAEAGIAGCRPHRLRHTFGTAIYEATGDLLLTRDALGHEDIKNTVIYAQVRPRKVKEALNQLSFN